MNNEKYTNLLIEETSPYLLQHAHNPVNWEPWSDEALTRAKLDNKPIIVSIGYSSCHWCHVMAHESFEDEEVARLMNENFVCIKVDREERPDIDHLYMDAVQMLTGQGGWPLNCFALPDGRPFYGGTYFPKQHWIQILQGITGIFNNEAEKAVEQADLIARQIINNHRILADIQNDSELPDIEAIFNNLAVNFDQNYGGIGLAPKFPMPAIYEFCLTYHYFSRNEDALQHSLNTLEKMIQGGIYDQIGGGFSRYSTDDKWFVPHFEKMLYDNAQMISLLSHAYQISRREDFKQCIEQTLEFIERDMLSPEGGFYSALDADSDGEEGKYYTWAHREFCDILMDDAKLIGEYFGVRKEGNWEKDRNILSVKVPVFELARQFNLTEEEVGERVRLSGKKLLDSRSERIKPGLDNKIIASWNALMIIALVDAYKALGNRHYLDLAVNCAEFIIRSMITKNTLQHFYPAKVKQEGFLEDYSALIMALIQLFEQTGNRKWLDHTKALLDICLDHFYDEESNLFYYESDTRSALITRKLEVSDNVIPSANSMMAMNLLQTSVLLSQAKYKEIAYKMLSRVSDKIVQYPSYYANWARIALLLKNESREIIVVGGMALDYLNQLSGEFRPDVLVAASENESDDLLFKGRFVPDQTLFYVCKNNTCDLPVVSLDEVLEILRSR